MKNNGALELKDELKNEVLKLCFDNSYLTYSRTIRTTNPKRQVGYKDNTIMEEIMQNEATRKMKNRQVKNVNSRKDMTKEQRILIS